jgi:hypothetical protein
MCYIIITLFSYKETNESVQDICLGERRNLFAISGDLPCIGTLEIVHANQNDLKKFESLRLAPNGGIDHDGAYQNIKRGFPILKRNIVIQMVANGDCCWEIYGTRKFQGGKQYLPHGEHLPEIQPISIKRVHCRY